MTHVTAVGDVAFDIKHMESKLCVTALAFAAGAHEGAGQVRKYTHEPYIAHPIAVAQLLSTYVPDVTESMIAAALLHDVVEDTEVTIDTLETLFGENVSKLVYELTNKSKTEDGNRKVRKRIDKEFLETVSAEAQTIKVADLIDNTKSIATFDVAFAPTYLREKRELLAVLTKADSSIRKVAVSQLELFLKDHIDEEAI